MWVDSLVKPQGLISSSHSQWGWNKTVLGPQRRRRPGRRWCVCSANGWHFLGIRSELQPGRKFNPFDSWRWSGSAWLPLVGDLCCKVTTAKEREVAIIDAAAVPILAGMNRKRLATGFFERI